MYSLESKLLNVDWDFMDKKVIIGSGNGLSYYEYIVVGVCITLVEPWSQFH